MGRAALGSAAKTEVITVRMTLADRQWLEARYPKASTGLTALLNAAKKESQK